MSIGVIVGDEDGGVERVANCSDIVMSTGQNGSNNGNLYLMISMIVGGLVVIILGILAVVWYKMRVNYLLQRQINMFKRIDQQLGRDNREYVIDKWTFKSL